MSSSLPSFHVSVLVLLALCTTTGVDGCSVTPSSAAVVAGDDLSLTCMTKDKSEFIITWRLERDAFNALVLFQSPSLNQDGSIRDKRKVADGYLVNDSDPRQVILTIINASTVQANYYYCMCITRWGDESSAFAYVSVLVSEPTFSNAMEITFGEPVIFTCSVSFNGSASTSMIIEDSSGNSLNTRNYFVTSKGLHSFSLDYIATENSSIFQEYICNLKLTNDASNTLMYSRKLNVSVHWTYEPTFSNATEITDGEPVIFTCSVSFNGSASTSMIIEDSSGNTLNTSNYDGTSKGLHSFSLDYTATAKSSIYQEYFCNVKLTNDASNTLMYSGTLNASVHWLSVQNVQIIPVDRTQCLDGKQCTINQTVRCTAEGNPKPVTFQWLTSVNGIRFTTSETSDIELTFQTTGSYSVQCIAFNEFIGTRYKSASSIFTTQVVDEPASGDQRVNGCSVTPSAAAVVAGDDLSLTCTTKNKSEWIYAWRLESGTDSAQLLYRSPSFNRDGSNKGDRTVADGYLVNDSDTNIQVILTIIKASTVQANYYYCICSGSSSAFAYVSVLESEPTFSNATEITDGKPVTFTCSVSFNGIANTTITIEDSSVKSFNTGNYVVTLKGPHKSSLDYSAIADSSVYQEYSCDVKLTNDTSKSIIYSKKLNASVEWVSVRNVQINSVYGAHCSDGKECTINQMVRCTAEGNPKPVTFQWLVSLNESEFNISETSGDQFTFTTTGSYALQCVALNEIMGTRYNGSSSVFKIQVVADESSEASGAVYKVGVDESSEPSGGEDRNSENTVVDEPASGDQKTIDESRTALIIGLVVGLWNIHD